jgi:aspartate kinase
VQVFKFGGASVKNADAVRNVKQIIDRYKNEKLLVVISAMGKTTNALEEVTHAFFHKKGNVNEILSAVKQQHFSIMDELFSGKGDTIYHDVENCFVEIDWIVEDEPHEDYSFVYDQIVSIGEIISTKIVCAYLKTQGINARWIDARSYIQTDNTYREGKVNWEETEKLIQKDLPKILENEIIISQGFIGGTSENYTTTLGREGSDFSAAIFAYCLNADAVTIWKDVPGVLNADPKLFNDTKKYEHLPYSEALEMTYYGATVIHPKTIKPLQNKHIPLLVKPFLAPSENGTTIGKMESVSFDTPAIIVKKNQILISVTTKDFSFITEDNMSFILGVFAQHQVKINTMQNSAMTFSCCIDNDEMKVNKLIESLQKEYKILYNDGIELVTIRHYNEDMIGKTIENRTLLLEQRSRNTVQLVLK